ncbi:uncharacterized protein LOC127835450 isoform X2 [Dreissena polymorpha]|uniref:uncharacterized protein LOC127835450 isoform X2 n=1 Tax=Dreissena polymorpha TaxID=45954 RepID=UPI00226455D8|nr:uncharacterized protein LOC127835450 isoform X2 [Dreissena polymorpha]
MKLPLRSRNIAGLLTIVGGVIMHLSIGATYTLGNFSPYFVSYYRNRTAETELRNEDSLWLMTATLFGGAIGVSMSGLMVNRFGPRISLILGIVVFCATTALNYFSVRGSYAAMVIIYGFINGFGNKIIYPIPVAIAIKCFPTRPSFVAGIILAGYGGGASIFNQVITAFINPDNYSPDLVTKEGDRYFTQPDLLDRVPYSFLVLGGLCFLLQVLGLLCIREPAPEVLGNTEKDLVETKHGTEELSLPIISNGKIEMTGKPEVVSIGSQTHVSDSIKRNSYHLGSSIILPTSAKDMGALEVIKLAFRTRAFYVVILSAMIINIGTGFVFNLYKSYGQTFIADDKFLSVVGSMSSVFNCLGRPFWGLVMDRFGYRATLWCISGGLTVSCATLTLTEMMPQGLFMLWVCVVTGLVCGQWASYPTTFSRLFGIKHMALLWGFISWGTAFSSLLTSIAGTGLKSSLGFSGLFYIASGTSGFGFLLTILFNGKDYTGGRI